MGMDIVKRIKVNLTYTTDHVSYYAQLKEVNNELADNIAIQCMNAIEAECKRQLELKEDSVNNKEV